MLPLSQCYATPDIIIPDNKLGGCTIKIDVLSRGLQWAGSLFWFKGLQYPHFILL